MLLQNPVFPVQFLETDETIQAGVKLYLLRLDLTDEIVSGNKWFKLKYNLQHALENGYSCVLSFGGAYSNHIHALAKAGSLSGIKTMGVIRGEPEYADNPTLRDAKAWGMELCFVNRQEYRQRHDSEYLKTLKARFSNPLIVPEGGSNKFAVQGAREIITPEILAKVNPDQIVLASGTGGTLAGVALSVPDIPVLGIPVLKKADFLFSDIENLMTESGADPTDNWDLDLEGHGGGYAKVSNDLIAFMDFMLKEHQLPLDQIYTAKMLSHLLKRIERGDYAEGSTILAIHTGGLQGARSLA
ncbi:1-aminocyclopropane-1-carboxylate deaminase/D-cysteine desulfhydrase [Neptuniibacter sp. QD72_48]|uniref:1-aminocyclopropane-1-carboxylate deaminase/D-cysteine desulfhydrase n=1 Tax=unclassified Neptuniibacter TaxID=2630693 RepID=UPI0039F617B1